MIYYFVPKGARSLPQSRWRTSYINYCVETRTRTSRVTKTHHTLSPRPGLPGGGGCAAERQDGWPLKEGRRARVMEVGSGAAPATVEHLGVEQLAYVAACLCVLEAAQHVLSILQQQHLVSVRARARARVGARVRVRVGVRLGLDDLQVGPGALPAHQPEGLHRRDRRHVGTTEEGEADAEAPGRVVRGRRTPE